VGVLSCKQHRAGMDYARWFAAADLDGDGRVSGAEAVQFFGRAGLAKAQLAKLWELADNPARGFLERGQFDRAMALITIAQVRGRSIAPKGRMPRRGPGSVARNATTTYTFGAHGTNLKMNVVESRGKHGW